MPSFTCSVVRPLCELIEGYMVRILRGQFFVLEDSSVCSNVNPWLDKKEKCVSVLASRGGK